MRSIREIQREAARLWRLCHVDGRLDAARARTVCDRLVDPDKPVAPAIVSSFHRLLQRASARQHARVESAVPLDPRTCQAIDDVLADRYGDAISTTFTVNPALIGGLCVTVGSDVYDDSVRARLAALDAHF